jgi:hypothetical protein
MSDLPKRRGAPLGNQNALKHGFYARQFRRTDLRDLDDHPLDNFDDEINLIRVSIRRVMERYQPDATLPEALEILRTVSLASLCLTRLVRTNQLVKPSTQSLIEQGLKEVFAEMTRSEEEPFRPLLNTDLDSSCSSPAQMPRPDSSGSFGQHELNGVDFKFNSIPGVAFP